ncbi:hypothetical protein, partial [Streptomyces albidoflavus]
MTLIIAAVLVMIGLSPSVAQASQAAPLEVVSHLSSVPPQQLPAKTFQQLKSGTPPESLGLSSESPAKVSPQSASTGPASLRSKTTQLGKMSGAGSIGASVMVTDPIKRTMTLAECKQHTADDASMWIPSRFAMCESKWFTTEWKKNKQVVGFTQMTVTAIGTIGASSRDVMFDYHYSDFYAYGTNAIDATFVGSDSHYVTVPDGIQLNGGGLDPGPQTIAQIKKDPHFMVSTRADVGQGMAPDDTVWAIWNMKFEPEYPAPWVEENPVAEWKFSSFGVRWDNSAYLPNYNPANILKTGGATFSYNVSPLRYSTAAAAEEHSVALHIQKAFTSPGSTQPANPAKRVAGQSASDPLHRLQKGLGQTNLNRYNANRR